jgi:hypothetical protein
VFTKIRRPSFYRPDGRGSCGHGYSLNRRFRRNRAQPFMRTRNREEDCHLPRPERLVLALASGNMLTPRRRRPVALTNLIDEGFTTVSGNPSPNPLRTAGLVESHQARPSLRPRFLLRAPRPAAPRGLARGPRFRCALASRELVARPAIELGDERIKGARGIAARRDLRSDDMTALP